MNNVELQKNVWESIKGSAAKAKKFEDLVAVSFSLISDSNEDLYVVVRDGQMSVEPYRYDDNNCEVEAAAEIVAKMFSGELSFDKAISDGFVKLKSGNIDKLKALECLVPSKKSAKKTEKPAAKAAAKPEEKKAAPAKAEEKKSAPAAKPEEKKTAAPASAPVKADEKKAAPAATVKPDNKKPAGSNCKKKK